MTKLVWRVQPAPTGPYRSFEARGWPMAHFDSKDGPPAAMLRAAYEYAGSFARQEDVGFDIKVEVANPNGNSFDWRPLKKRVRSIKEAKKLVNAFYKAHPEFIRGGVDEK